MGHTNLNLISLGISIAHDDGGSGSECGQYYDTVCVCVNGESSLGGDVFLYSSAFRCCSASGESNSGLRNEYSFAPVQESDINSQSQSTRTFDIPT